MKSPPNLHSTSFKLFISVENDNDANNENYGSVAAEGVAEGRRQSGHLQSNPPSTSAQTNEGETRDHLWCSYRGGGLRGSGIDAFCRPIFRKLPNTKF